MLGLDNSHLLLLMIINLVAIACASACALLAYQLHVTLFNLYGGRRWGRMAAYLALAQLLWIGLGIMEALLGNGWHYMKAANLEVYTSWRQALTIVLVLGVPSGLVGFVFGELQGGRSLFEISLPYYYWDEYTNRTLSAEPTSSATERRRAAKVIWSTAKAAGQDLSPELSAYVFRNTRDKDDMRG